ncbi:MAG: lipopolysaccharide biosynthesis protein [Mesorhizobium sp.]|nr:lipopolysaccharide biosynthesis protein [Mesorhizobium sp.]MCO5160403.1 lipopolysaccharide biosynthesis protein [Mesorhizobium sp.]
MRGRLGLVRDYASAISGSAGRLVFSLIYFVALANTLSIADFGLFATASATGVMLSRILAFGYITALYRTATVRPALIGVFTAGFMLMAVVSLPVLGLSSLGAHAVFFGNEMALSVFLTVIAAEALLWRPVEAVVIVNNGMGRFGRAAVLVILGTVLRAAAAGAFVFLPMRDLPTWSFLYLGANAVSLLVAAAFFYPSCRLRLMPRLYLRRLPDSLYVAGAEILFYLQMEMDKLLVLALGGPHLAGIYAMIMRLVDLTAIPIRTFTMMLVQRLMRAPELLARTIRRIGLEAAVFATSTVALAALAVILHFFPTLLGKNVAEAAPLLGLALFVPGLRNLVEYQAELLFARGQTLLRAINLALLAGLKAVLLALLLVQSLEVDQLVLWLNAVFAALYLASALLTYTAMRLPAKAA